MNWSKVFNTFLGFVLAIALLAGATALAIRYLIVSLTAPPPKPIFANERTAARPTKVSRAPVTPQPTPDEMPSETPSPSPSLPPGAYKARVTQSIGLILRDSPSREAGQIGGIAYNERVIVLESSPDNNWQKVRVVDSDREGWVKGGNVERETE